MLPCANAKNSVLGQAEVGKAVTESLEDGSLTSREDLWVTSKLWNNFHRPELVRDGAIQSITNLGVESLDLYLIHFPVSFTPGTVEATSADQVEDVPLSETWQAMEKLVDEGLVKNIGVSNFEIADLQQIEAVATKPIAVNQFETHPYYQRSELVEYCAQAGIVVTAHSSMGGGANAMKSFHTSAPLVEDATVGAIAKKHGTTPQAVLLAWGLQRPTAIIPKSVTPARITSNLHDVLQLSLDGEDLAQIAALDKPGLEGCYCVRRQRFEVTEPMPPSSRPVDGGTVAHRSLTLLTEVTTTVLSHGSRTTDSHGFKSRPNSIRRRLGSAARSSPAAPRTTTAKNTVHLSSPLPRLWRPLAAGPVSTLHWCIGGGRRSPPAPSGPCIVRTTATPARPRLARVATWWWFDVVVTG